MGVQVIEGKFRRSPDRGTRIHETRATMDNGISAQALFREGLLPKLKPGELGSCRLGQASTLGRRDRAKEALER